MKRTLVRFALACLLTGCGGSSAPSGVSRLYNPGTAWGASIPGDLGSRGSRTSV